MNWYSYDAAVLLAPPCDILKVLLEARQRLSNHVWDFVAEQIHNRKAT